MGAVFSMEWWAADGSEKTFKATDDFCCSIGCICIQLVRFALVRDKMMKPFAQGLKSFLPAKYYDQHLDNVVEQRWLGMDWSRFKEAFFGITYKKGEDEIRDKLNTQVNQLDAMRSEQMKDRDVFEEISMFQNVLFLLRELMIDGPRGQVVDVKKTTLDDFLCLKKFDLDKNSFDLNKDLRVTGKLRNGSKEDMEDYAEHYDHDLVFEADEEDNTFVAYFLQPFDIFTLVGSFWVDLRPIRDRHYTLKNNTQVHGGVVQAQPHVKPVTAVASNKLANYEEVPRTLDSAVVWLQVNLNKDANKHPDLACGNCPEARELDISKTSKRSFLQVVKPGKRKISETSGGR